MAKKAVYEPGELESVKKRLGPIDEKEAKRMQKLLGGEIGEEKSPSSDAGAESGRSDGSLRKNGPPGDEVSRPKHTVEIAPPADGVPPQSGAARRFQRSSTLSYGERVKMDILAGNSRFGIKTMMQIIVSRLSFFKPPPDKVSPWFVRANLNEYYRQLERLVTSTRLIFPRSNAELGNKLQKTSQTAFKILNTIRQWKLDVISSEIGRLQTHPRNALVKDFEVILREIYRPLYILDKLDAENDVRKAFNVLYEILFMENPTKETEKQQTRIAEAVNSWQYVRYKLRSLLYPLLMKTIAEYFQEYEFFFLDNEENYLLFLGLTESDQILPDSRPWSISTPDEEQADDNTEEAALPAGTLSNIDSVEKETATEMLDTAETKAFERGIGILETLFPQSPWNKLETFPDFYPYFSDVLEIKKNGELLAPEDPVHPALILAQIIEELLYGFRYIKFVETPDAESLNSIGDDWHTAISEAFEKKYLLRINEYAHYFEHAAEKKTSTYALNIASDIHWMRRYWFLPNYVNTPPTPPSFAKKDVLPLYSTARRLRRDLTACAAAIEAANISGGAAASAPIEKIENPWEPYNFQIENPLSKRLDMLLVKKQRNNASLIFFTLAIAAVLDIYLNDKNSIAYRADFETLFRTTGGENPKPVFWVEKQSGAFALFKESVGAMRKSAGKPPQGGR
ncbi:MAG: hypothetical protein LBF80_03215 [Spirochaetaceae bacterium]|jgi:hypothetical protein|nr:hypothetical protein [Spirochaetaceae bacterium]